MKPATSGNLLSLTAPKCVLAGLAAYSAGEDVNACLEWFDRAVTAAVEADKRRDYKAAGPGNLLYNMDLYSAASLVGRAKELVASRAKYAYSNSMLPWEDAIYSEFHAVFGDKPFPENAEHGTALKKLPKDYDTVPPLLAAVSARDKKAFPPRLNEYLRTTWAKTAKATKPGPGYPGIWSLLAPALSLKMGGVPELPAETAKYVPIELVEAAKTQKRS
jgi:hypothetical protein